MDLVVHTIVVDATGAITLVPVVVIYIVVINVEIAKICAAKPIVQMLVTWVVEAVFVLTIVVIFVEIVPGHVGPAVLVPPMQDFKYNYN